jgi:hypothetical protein
MCIRDSKHKVPVDHAIVDCRFENNIAEQLEEEVDHSLY